MFIKKIVKDDKTYFILTICNRVEKGQGKGKDKDTQFISCFIPEELANTLLSFGVPLQKKKGADNNEEKK